MPRSIDTDDDWSWKSIVKLCKLVEERSVLYDHTSNNHTKAQLDRAWLEISREIGFPADTCKNKWKNIRNSYSRDLRNRRYKIHKRYYLEKHVKFLRQFLTWRSAILPGGAGDEQEGTVEIDWVDGGGDVKATEPDVTAACKVEADSSDSEGGLQRQLDERLDEREQFKFVSAEGAGGDEGVDPDLAFLRSVLPDMRTMPADTKRRFKIAVLKLCDQILAASDD